MRAAPTMLTLNAGSSSLKFAIYDRRTPDRRVLRGQFESLGQPEAVLKLVPGDGEAKAETAGSIDHAGAAAMLLDRLDREIGLNGVVAVGHRVVHGGPGFRDPTRVDDAVLDELARIESFAPEHLPAAIGIMRLCLEKLPGVVQIACFDTAFHRDMPLVARTLPIPRCYASGGVERYGFHGLSYTFLLEQLGKEAGTSAAQGKIVLAHLGNGASLAAVREGRSMDTTMGFTPSAGIPMASRSGDVDPGLVRYLARSHGMDAEAFDHMVNHQSGLLGISEISGDIRILLEREEEDFRAREAIALYCYRVRLAIGAFAAALEGLDTLVFSGGVGENAPAIRERVCAGLGFLGIELDPARNRAGAPLVSQDGGGVAVRVIKTDEEAVMARAVAAHLDATTRQKGNR